MSAPIVVRPATVDDVPAIQAVAVAAAERFRGVEDPRIARLRTLRRTGRPGWRGPASSSAPGSRVDDGGSIIGFAVAWVVDGEGHLDELAVAPEHGRRGVGRALVDQVVAWTVARG